MSKLNVYLSYVPCQKDEDSSPWQMERAGKKLNEMDMFTAIIGILSVDLATTYWAEKGSSHFPLGVKTLIEDLIPKEVQVKAQKPRLK